MVFTGEARVCMSHGVLREVPIKKLPTAEDIDADPDWGLNMRIVATLRGGELTLAEDKEWCGHHASDFGIPNPYKKQAPTKAAAKREPVPQVPRASKRTKVSTSTAASAKPIKGVGAVVRAEYAKLPRVGEFINLSSNTQWKQTKVIALHNNFVVTEELARKDCISMRCGTQFKVRIPPLDDNVTVVSVLLVGEIHAGQATHKYRAAVFRRKIEGAKKWGEIEVLDGSAFPSPLNCEVSARTHTHGQ